MAIKNRKPKSFNKFSQSKKPRRLYPVRRGQLISPFGVGAITDFPNDEAMMCAGLDAWFPAGQHPDPGLRIAEERLQYRLNCDYFVRPPEFGDSGGVSGRKIPYVRFPRWHYCTRCFRMKRAALFGQQSRCDNIEKGCCKPGNNGRRMIPVRIVAVCDGGHIQDFPFREWIKCSCEEEGAARLMFKAGRSAASLAGIWIECETCGKRKSLAMAFQDGILPQNGVNCCGGQPWLGRDVGTACPSQLKTVQRGASNVYFPIVASSIYIPAEAHNESEAMTAVLDRPDYWGLLSSGLVDGQPNRQICDMFAKQATLDCDEFYAAVSSRLTASAGRVGAAATDEDFRKQEYDILASGNGDLNRDLFVESVPGEQYGRYSEFISSVGLVRKLRETRVLTGFSRVHPKSDRNDTGSQKLSISPNLRWLPAIDTRGEGIFIRLRQDRIDEWTRLTPAIRRVEIVIKEINRKRSSKDKPPVQSKDLLRFMMIHTLAHVMMRELIFTCGYGSSSLRERIYCNMEDPRIRMDGFLLYTASGDSEGSLGGLVARGSPDMLCDTFASALKRATWCSNDPICMESPGQGVSDHNLAACHGCAMVPETSCEFGNHQLDRATLIGTIEDPNMGFFAGFDRIDSP